MSRPWMPLLALGALTGCAGSDGVWLLFVDPLVLSDPTTTVEHDFLGATVREGDTTDPEWTLDEVYEASEALAFAEIFDVAGEDQKILVADGRVYLGNKSGGLWTFTWTNSEHEGETQTHQSGYSYATDSQDTFETVITLDLSGGTATGTFENTLTTVRSWTESDIWDPDAVRRYSGQIPANTWLEATDGGGVSNAADETDCSADPCFITVTASAVLSAPIAGRRTELSHDDYDGVDGTGQPPGTSSN